jgi:transcriptional regulator with XRE-family HTH domain
MPALTAATSPLAARRRLGDELRHLRDRAAMTTEDVGRYLHCHNSKISRIETAKRTCTRADFEGLMTLYEVEGPKLAELTALMVRARQRVQPWWHAYMDVLSANYAEFLAYEAEAARCVEYQSVFVPALLQTPDYAQAVTNRGISALGPDQVDTLVAVRMRRQERLRDVEPLLLDMIVAESALHFCVGGPEVMRAQLRHLVAVSMLENVSVRVTPFTAGENGVSTGAFTLFAPGKEQDADVAFTETTEATTEFRDDALAVRRLRRLFSNLSAASLSEQASRELIERIEKEWI